MNAKGAILGAFVGCAAIITWRDFKNPSSDWPLPAPPPYRYVGAAIAFGLLALVADMINPKIAATIAIGLLVGLGFQTAQGYQKPDSSSGIQKFDNGLSGSQQV